MIKEDLDKRLEEIETKIQELEDMILDNKLKIMELQNKKPEEKENISLGKPAEEKKSDKKDDKPIKKLFNIKKIEEEKKGEEDELGHRAKKIKDMLRDLK